MPSRAGPKPSPAKSVFINCPFDPAYKPLLRAACFAILACGYAPRCALDYSDSGAVRFAEIVKMIVECDFSVHDISRVELDKDSLLPRFNMPLELGADLGLRLEGPARQRRRKTLILDAELHRYDKTLSDISGMDIDAHGNDPRRVIHRVRDWLDANRKAGSPLLPGAAAINHDYEAYLKIAPDIIAGLRLDPHDELPHGDYLHVVETALPMLEAARRDKPQSTAASGRPTPTLSAIDWPRGSSAGRPPERRGGTRPCAQQLSNSGEREPHHRFLPQRRSRPNAATRNVEGMLKPSSGAVHPPP